MGAIVLAASPDAVRPSHCNNVIELSHGCHGAVIVER
jgi:hypothetical protein